MSDNVTVTAGSYTAIVATDDVGGFQQQRVKITWGVDGIGVDTSASNPLPVVQTGTLNIGTVSTVTSVTTVGAVTGITNALPTGSNVIGGVTQSGIWTSRTQDGSGNSIGSTSNALDVHVKSTAAGSNVVTEDASIPSGATLVAQVIGTDYSYNEALTTWTRDGGAIFFSYDLDETEEDVKTTAGRIWGYTFSNLHATLGRWLRFYNATAAATTVGSTAALFPVYMPPNATGHIWCGKDGPVFSTALCAAATAATGPTDATALGANEVMLTVWYK